MTSLPPYTLAAARIGTAMTDDLKDSGIEPPDWPHVPGGIFGAAIMSNCYDDDEEDAIDRDVERQLRQHQMMAKFPGWDFNADVWFADDGRFHAAVYVHHVRQAIISASTLEDLRTQVRQRFGRD